MDRESWAPPPFVFWRPYGAHTLATTLFPEICARKAAATVGSQAWENSHETRFLAHQIRQP